VPNMAKELTQSQVIELLKKRQGKRPAKALAEELGISAVYLSDIFNGKRDPGPAVLEKLGLEREVLVVYRKAEASA
jgi:transcriptional regulator with XRE-family HTH domain